MKAAWPLTLLFLVLAIAMGCNNQRKPKDTTTKPVYHQVNKADSERNDSIAFAQIEKLPEYKHLLKWFDKVNKDTARHIIVLLDHEPTKNFNYYQLTIGEDARINVVDIEHFYVNAATLFVKHVDLEADSATTLAQWRKSGKDDWLK